MLERLILEGLTTKTFRSLTAVAGMLVCSYGARAADLSLAATGNLVGSVVNAEGVPQMGASVQLFDRMGRLRARTNSLIDGRFGFAGLATDLYSVRVTLADYLPAISERISVRPGLDSVLEIHLATLLSSVQLRYAVPSAAMSKEWKWVLRSSPATRPVTRFQKEEPQLITTSDSSAGEQRSHVFSGTHAALSVSGGASSFLATDSLGPVGGTGFAVSTNILGKNELRLGGSLGQSNTVIPGALVLSAFYARQDSASGPSPEVTVRVTQLGLINGLSGPGTSQGQVRTMSVSLYQRMDLPGDFQLEYGATGETVEYDDYTARSSPFLRVSRSFGNAGQVIASFSDGTRPDPLLAHQGGSDLQDAESPTSSFAPLPQLSYRNGRIEMQRTASFEAGYRKIGRQRTVAVSAFNEKVSNGRVDVAGDRGTLDSSNLMSDGFSATSVYNIGRFNRWGVVASADQRLLSIVDVGLSYGCLGGFTTSSGTLDPGGIISGFLQQRLLNTANAELRVRVPKAGTRISSNYGWVDGRAIIPDHVFTTQNNSLTPGLNFSFRQPLPSLFGMPGRLELRADVRNLLAQGYLPVYAGDGRTLLVVQAPRSIRGGVNFIF